MGDTLVAATGPNIKVAKRDLDIMAGYGLLLLDFSARGTPNYSISPVGLRFHAWLREQQGRPIEQVEAAMRGLLDADWFTERYPSAHAKWSQAEAALWSEDAEERLSAIGHDAQEALQEFADASSESGDSKTPSPPTSNSPSLGSKPSSMLPK